MTMRFHQIKSVFQKDLRSFFRDWRTLLVMALPVIFWPVIGLLVSELIIIKKKADEKDEETKIVVKATHIRITSLNVPDDATFFKRLRADKNIELVLSQKPLEDLKNQKTDYVLEAPSDTKEILRQNKQVTLKIHYDNARSYSADTNKRVYDVLHAYQNDVLRARLQNSSLTDDDLKPPLIFEETGIGASSDVKESVDLFRGYCACMLSLFVIILALPAFPFLLEEKEGGTLVTILSSPLSFSELFAAKSLMFMAIMFIQMILWIASTTFAWGAFFAAGGSVRAAVLSLYGLHGPIFHHGPVLYLCLFQNIIFVVAVSLLISSYVKSFREASNSLSFFTTITLLLSMPALIPKFSPSGILFCVPALNTALIVKELGSGIFNSIHFIAAFLSTLFYTSGCFFLAYKLFGREEMVFGGVSSLSLSLKPSNIVEKPVPTQSEALVFCFVAMILFLHLGLPLQLRGTVTGLIQTLLIIFFVLPIIFAAYRKCDFRKTFRLYLPSLKAVLSSAALFAGIELTLGAVMLLQNWALPLPSEFVDAWDRLLRELWQKYSPAGGFVIIALLPGVCEELTFRGFVLSGFLNRCKPMTAIVGSALLFAIFHLDVFRFIPVFLLGAALGFVVWRSGSILTGMLFHTLHNGLAFVMTNLPEADKRGILNLMEPSPQTVLSGIMLIGIGLFLLLRKTSVSQNNEKVASES